MKITIIQQKTFPEVQEIEGVIDEQYQFSITVFNGKSASDLMWNGKQFDGIQKLSLGISKTDGAYYKSTWIISPRSIKAKNILEFLLTHFTHETARLKAILDSGVPYHLEQDAVNWEMSDNPRKILIKVGTDLIDLNKGDELAIRFLPSSFKAFALNVLYYCKVVEHTDDEVWCDVFHREEFESEEALDEAIKLRYGQNL